MADKFIHEFIGKIDIITIDTTNVKDFTVFSLTNLCGAEKVLNLR